MLCKHLKHSVLCHSYVSDLLAQQAYDNFLMFTICCNLTLRVDAT